MDTKHRVAFFILTMSPSHVPCTAYYTLITRSTHCIPDTAWGLNSRGESNIWGTIWSFSLEISQLGSGMQEGVAPPGACPLPPEVLFPFLCLGSPTILSLQKICFLVTCPVCLSLCLRSLLVCVPVSQFVCQFTLPFSAFSAWGFPPLMSQCFLSPIMLFCLSILSDGELSPSQSLSSLHHLALI